MSVHPDFSAINSKGLTPGFMVPIFAAQNVGGSQHYRNACLQAFSRPVAVPQMTADMGGARRALTVALSLLAHDTKKTRQDYFGSEQSLFDDFAYVQDLVRASGLGGYAEWRNALRNALSAAHTIIRSLKSDIRKKGDAACAQAEHASLSRLVTEATHAAEIANRLERRAAAKRAVIISLIAYRLPPREISSLADIPGYARAARLVAQQLRVRYRNAEFKVSGPDAQAWALFNGLGVLDDTRISSISGRARGLHRRLKKLQRLMRRARKTDDPDTRRIVSSSIARNRPALRDLRSFLDKLEAKERTVDYPLHVVMGPEALSRSACATPEIRQGRRQLVSL